MSQSATPRAGSEVDQLTQLQEQTIEIEAQKIAKQRARAEKEKEKQRQLKQKQRSQLITMGLLIGTIIICLLLSFLRRI